MNDVNNNAQAILNAGAALAKTIVIEGVPHILVPDGYNLENHQHLLGQPTRKKGAAILLDAKSFISYVNQEQTKELRLYGTITTPGITAVFNDHSNNGAGWGDYKAKYQFPFSREWKLWDKIDGTAMNQETFALFIETNSLDIVKPTAADMLELAKTLQIKKDINFASGIRLDNGQHQFKYEEVVNGTAGASGQLEIPQIVSLGLPVFEGTERYEVQARLRYRLTQGKIAIWFDIIGKERIIEDAVKQVFEEIAEGTGVDGTPREILIGSGT